tara:strand:- start:1104 stop:2336 length:1233 start_codon:yes stop_codon:yes gene_type:complete
MPRGTPLIKELAQDYELLNEQIKEQGFIEAKLNGLIDQRERQLTTLIAAEDKSLKLTREKVDSLKEAPEEAVKFGNALRNTFPTFIGILESIKDVKDTIDDLGLGGFAKFGAVAFAVGKAFDFIATSVTETRKELGVTANEAASIAIQQKLIAFQGKLFGLESEDISQASLAIRENLGVSAQEATSLSLSFARTAAATGQTADQLSNTLVALEGVSSASREVLLNQLRTNAAIIGKAGVTPSVVLQDIAQNTEFFATFAKEGGDNILRAAIAAKSLGSELGTVSGIAESLLDFESSIEAQLEASLLLGRQINLDRARQLFFVGKTEQGLQEVLKQVGSEAEFTRLLPIQRQKLASAVGLNVEQLSRLVRNNAAGVTGAALGASIGGDNVLLGPLEDIRNYSKKTADAVTG